MRSPDLIIGPRDNPQTLRWHIFRWRGWQLSLHKWLRSDDDRALHDHSGDNLSVILTQFGYWELVRTREWEEGGAPRRPEFAEFRLTHWGDGEFYRDVDTWHWRRPFVPYFRKAETPHRVALGRSASPIWSLWLRWPPRREWGFHCPKGWRHWRDYLNSRGDYYSAGISETGPGCE